MNRTIAVLCVALSACGEVDEPKTAVQRGRLHAESEGLPECVENRCAEGLVCIEYRLATGPTKRCVTAGQTCEPLDCGDDEQCIIFTRLPGIAACAVIISRP